MVCQLSMWTCVCCFCTCHNIIFVVSCHIFLGNLFVRMFYQCILSLHGNLDNSEIYRTDSLSGSYLLIGHQFIIWLFSSIYIFISLNVVFLNMVVSCCDRALLKFPKEPMNLGHFRACEVCPVLLFNHQIGNCKMTRDAETALKPNFSML